MRNFLRLMRVYLNREKSLRGVYIELCSRCNLRCGCCGLDHTRGEMFLDTFLFSKFCEGLIDGGYSVVDFVLALSGESLRHPHFKVFLEILGLYRDAIGIENVVLSSNVVLLDRAMAETIISSGVVDLIQCSIDGQDAASFEQLRRPAKFDVVLDNLLALCAINNLHGRPVTIMINNGGLNDAREYSASFRRIMAAVDYTNIYKYHEWGRSLVVNSPKSFCRYAFRFVTLLVDGQIGKCCYDLNGNTAYGDSKTHRLEQILTSKRRKQDLFKMFLGKRDDIEGCAGCTVED